MKLRLRENSIRMRLLKSEIAQLGKEGVVSEKIRFSVDQKITYTIRVDQTASKIFSRFENAEITVNIPADLARNWIETEKVGLEHYQSIDKEPGLDIMLEKDFVCLTRPMDGDNLDAFPNPESESC